MASKDYKNQTKSVVSIIPQTASGNVNGAEVDTKGFEGVTLKLSAAAGSVAGTVKIQESDNILKNVGSESLIHHLILIPGINAMTFPGER